MRHIQNKSIKEILDKCIHSIKSDFGYDSVELYCRYKYTNNIERAAESSNALPLRDIRDIQTFMFSEKVHEEYGSNGKVTLYLPISTPENFNIQNSSKTGNPKNVFYSHWALLVVVCSSKPSEQSLKILNHLSLELNHIFESYELLQYQRIMQECLSETDRISRNISAVSEISQMFTLWRDTKIVGQLFDGVAIWIDKNAKKPGNTICYGTDNVVDLNLATIFPESKRGETQEFYDIGVAGCYSAIFHPLIYKNTFIGAIAFFKSYKRTLRTEEISAAQMIAEQISSNIKSFFLYKRVEEQNLKLNYEKEFNKKVFRSINSGLIIVSEAGNVITANPYALDKLGFSLEELTGVSLDKFIPGLLSAVTETRNESVFLLSNQREVHLGFRMSHLQLSDNNSGKIIYLRDISEIIELRNELDRKEYFSTVGKMSSWIAHEVRNPTFVISTVARILLKQAKNSEQERFITSILTATKLLSNLIDDLLIYSRPLELKLENVLISDFVSGVADGMKTLADESGGVITTKYDKNEIYTLIDKESFQQVIYNLIKNSFEADATSVNITTSSTAKKLKLSIIDNGKGIKPTHIDKMFVPFITTKKGGSGLGLSICKKILEEHGGTIQVSNIPEKGVHIQIELKKASQHLTALPSDPAHP